MKKQSNLRISVSNLRSGEGIKGDKLIADFLNRTFGRASTPQEEARNSVRKIVEEIKKEGIKG